MASRTLPWQLICLLFAVLSSAANITSSNSSTAIANWTGSIEIQTTNDPVTNLSSLVPLSNKAASIKDNNPVEGNLVFADASTANDSGTVNARNQTIAYLSCNADDYPGFTTVETVFGGIFSHGLTALVLYSTAEDFCQFSGLSPTLQEFPIFSMTKKSDSEQMLKNVQNPSVATGYNIQIKSWGNGKDESNNTPQGQNPLGPSPSTAVAMIILYSITGIITALFLVIIITGAVRAHRHPDRYGPRDVMGRPRQSRARGLGRAILDTLPIVKFGEREPPKPTDVELGTTPEARNVDGTPAEGAVHDPTKETTTEMTSAQPAESARSIAEEQQSGIAPALPAAGAAAPASESDSPDEGLGCSICTEDFEKGQDIRVLPCNHKFHPDCVDPWLLNVSGTCPLCRVDLRPAGSRDSIDSHNPDDLDPDALAPPMQPEADTNRHRRSALIRDLLPLRNRPTATAEERLGALRRFREQRRNASREGLAVPGQSGSPNGSQEDVAGMRRSRRISTRVLDVFSTRTRRGNEEGAPSASGEPSAETVPGSSSQAGSSNQAGSSSQPASRS
ncbi:hypothetical protein P154DRAFT_517376 [Amniculicola lignicola CBS 123094]|uniref:RING-type domain-containing protein n=1 Tax=Amniculicola lignicola CBS 123094 TaxID=1392246 RepID=A0A6A5X2Y1_9PLEO|nr:hypothetical protein P154DRAFT_517376 [Amniculicola lignicola CBS 123094]